MGMMGTSGIPRFLAVVRPDSKNISVTMVAVGIPRFSSEMASSTLPDVQDPHPPTAVTTRSALLASSSMSSREAPLV